MDLTQIIIAVSCSGIPVSYDRTGGVIQAGILNKNFMNIFIPLNHHRFMVKRTNEYWVLKRVILGIRNIGNEDCFDYKSE